MAVSVAEVFADVDDGDRCLMSQSGRLRCQITAIQLGVIAALTDQLHIGVAQADGVDPNEEAAQMIIFERMFQSMSKFITVQDQALQELMNMI